MWTGIPTVVFLQITAVVGGIGQWRAVALGEIFIEFKPRLVGKV